MNLPAKIPLAQTLSALAQILEQVELAGGEVSDELIPDFQAMAESFKSAVDRRIFLVREATSQAELLNNMALSLTGQRKALLKIADKVKARTMDYMLQNPGIEFKGNLGEIKLAKSGGAAGIEYMVALQSLSHIVDPTDKCKIPEKYLDKVTVYVLKKDEFEHDLRAGNAEAPDAALLKERSTHVRFS